MMMSAESLIKRRLELQQEQRKAEVALQRIIGALLLLDELIEECQRVCSKANEEETSNKAS